MKNLIALVVFVTSVGIVNAGSLASPTTSQTRSTPAKTHTAARAKAPTPPDVKLIPLPVAAADVDPLTVTGTRPHSFDFHGSKSFVDFRSTASRPLSEPPSFDVVNEPVRLTVGTGNTDQLQVRYVEFPFESAQDRTVRNSDVLKVWLTKFKIG